ncbi:MAG: dipeptide epimerase [Planctomycetaceae bacterium]
MQIVRFAAFHVRIPLKRTVKHASHTRDSNDTLLVRCELDDGTAGWGEGLPRPYVTGETIDTAWAQLQATDFAAQLSARLTSLSSTLENLDAFKLAGLSSLNPQPSTARDCFGNAVRCAYEISILDAACRRETVPLSHVTALVSETAPIRRSAASVRYSGVLTAMTPREQLRSALKQRLYGFRQCKVKVGADGSEDAATLRRVRRVLGPRVDLRIDANEAWSCAELAAKLDSLSPLGIAAVEQPVPHAEVGGLVDVRKQTDVPIMLDESLCSLSDGRRAIDGGWCDLFNIRLSKCGGFIPSLRLAALAKRAGLGYQLGCQVGETGILSAAGRHFATSVGSIRYLEGSYDRHLVAERLTVEDVTFGYGGRAPALTAPGLGVTVDRQAVARCTVRQQVLWER